MLSSVGVALCRNGQSSGAWQRVSEKSNDHARTAAFCFLRNDGSEDSGKPGKKRFVLCGVGRKMRPFIFSFPEFADVDQVR